MALPSVETQKIPSWFSRARNSRRMIINRQNDWEGDIWGTQGSPLSKYDEWFKYVLDFKLTDYILSLKDPVVIDLMSSTDTLAKFFMTHPSEHKLGISVSLGEQRPGKPREDQRNDSQKVRDDIAGVRRIAGNLASSYTWDNIEDTLSGRKADVILERGWGAVEYFPQHPAFYAMAVSRAWRMLSENNGLLVAQLLPIQKIRDAGIDFAGWARLVENSGVPIRWEDQTRHRFTVISMRKQPGSPSEIPLLK